MSRVFTLIAENIAVIIGFALYGIVVYYMIAKALRRYAKKKSAHGRYQGSSDPIPGEEETQISSLDIHFLNFLDHDAEKTLKKKKSRRDFSSEIPTANPYANKNFQKE